MAQIYGKIPARYLDTMAMSSAIYVGSKSHSLKVMCERIWPHDLTKRKGDELAKSFGFRDLDDELFGDIKYLFSLKIFINNTTNLPRFK